MLEAFRQLAVREEYIVVLHVELFGMKQDSDEPVRNFVARLRGHASQCKFLVKCATCNKDVSYMDQLLKEYVIRSVYDHEIQSDILGNRDQEMSLESLIKFIEARGGRRSTHKHGYATSGHRSYQ